GLHLLQLADDLLDVATGAEAAALAGDHQHADVAAVGQLGDQVAQVGVALEGQRVQLLRAVEGDGGDAVLHLEVEVLPLLRERRRSAERAHAWIPPPSMTMVWPLIGAASGEASQTSVAATSCGSTSLPSSAWRSSARRLSAGSRPVAATMP